MTLVPTEPRDAQSDGVLEHFLAQVIVDEYADVLPDPASSSRQVRSWVSVAAAGLIGLLVAAAVVNTRVSDDQRQQTHAALAARVAAMSAGVEKRQARVDEQSADVDALRADLLAATVTDTQAAERDRLAALAGTEALTGPGITVTIDDAPDAAAGSLNRVLDRDLQDIVNTLWRLGASGIAVNGQRLTGATAIRGAGEAILVNYQPLSRPYRVAATGIGTVDPGLTGLLSALTSDYGLVTDVGLGDVALPAGEVRTPRFAIAEDGDAAS